MNFWKLSPWLSRLIIASVAGLFLMIGLKFALDPLHAAADSGIALQPGPGFTNTRAGFGGFPIGFAALLLFSLFSAARLKAALASIATLAAVILAVRLYGAALDDTFSQSAHLLIPEVAILLLALLGVLIESKRRGHDAATG
jgi:hypothetical protein